jgi:hypothetical protein
MYTYKYNIYSLLHDVNLAQSPTESSDFQLNQQSKEKKDGNISWLPLLEDVWLLAIVYHN